MSEFGGLGLQAAGMGINEVKAAIAEVSSALNETFTGNRTLAFNFPQEAINPGDADFGATARYNFTWEVEKTITVRSLYFSHGRAVLRVYKNEERQAVQRFVQAKSRVGAEPESETKARIEKQVRLATKRALAVKYSDKYLEANQMCKSLPDPTQKLKGWIIAHLEKYGYAKHVAQEKAGLATAYKPLVFGNDIAEKILEDNRFKDKLQKATDAEYHRLQMEFLKIDHPDSDQGELANKASKIGGKNLMQSKGKSVVVAYEVRYKVLKVNMGDVENRWQTLNEKLLKKQGALEVDYAKARKLKSELLNSTIATIRDYQKAMKGDPASKGSSLADQHKNFLAAQWKVVEAERSKIDEEQKIYNSLKASYEEQRKTLDAEMPKINEVAKGLRTIGGVTMRNVDSCGSNQTKVRWRNTNASLSAAVQVTDNNQFIINLKWAEESKTAVPVAGKLFSNMYYAFGSLQFGVNGLVRSEGKIGERFAAFKLDTIEVPASTPAAK